MAIYCLRYKYIYTQQQVPRLVIISSCVQNRSLYSDFQIWSRYREINAKSCHQIDVLVMGTKACLWILYNNTFSVWYTFWNKFQLLYLLRLKICIICKICNLVVNSFNSKLLSLICICFLKPVSYTHLRAHET